MSTSLLRARQVARLAGVDASTLERVPSGNNEVWLAGDVVLRIAVSGASRRLGHEADVATLLPPEALHPGVLGSGWAGFGEWLALRRVPGVPLSKAWQDLDDHDRRRAVHQLGELMRVVHAVQVPLDHPVQRPPWGASWECPHPLPEARLASVVARLAARPDVDRGLLHSAASLADELLPMLGPRPRSLVHGDLHFGNVLWDGTQISALIDWEFAEPAWPDQDLDILIRWCSDPEAMRREELRSVPQWLAEAVPELLECDGLTARLGLYALAYDLADLARSGPDDGSPHHPASRLRQLVAGRVPQLAW